MNVRVRLLPSGHEFEAPLEQNLLQSALDAGFATAYSCRTGNCRTCRAQVESGTVDHARTPLQFLSAEERAAGFALLCQARPLGDLTIRATELSGLSKPRIFPCRVLRIEKPASDVALLELRFPPTEPIRFAAGQYLEVFLEDGERRAYSIADKPTASGASRLTVHVRHTPGGRFTDRVFGTLRERDLLKVEGPLGTFVLREEAAGPIVFVAAGTGFAPIKSMIEDLLAKRINESRPISLYWGARTRSGLYLLELAERWAREAANFRFVPVLSEPTDACDWTGRTGFVHRAVMDDLPDLESHQVYACGAPVMVEAARADFAACGLAPEAFFADEFLTEADRHRSLEATS